LILVTASVLVLVVSYLSNEKPRGHKNHSSSMEKVHNPQIQITTEPPSLGGFFDCSAYPHEDIFEVSCECIRSH
tara:strand:- start:434 stop:655 length:222 start_codon:yes stop_codon:yes gene_type:complete